jgi:hypothetical protein
VNWIKLDVDVVRWRSPVVTGINHQILTEGIILLAAGTVLRVGFGIHVHLVYSEARAPGCIGCSLTYLKIKV